MGRNDPCPCGSQRRFKNCCLKSGRYDGARRDYYFQRAPLTRRFLIQFDFDVANFFLTSG
ncbi:MAG: SEC-C metal-binding domain-containing protein [Pseudomonadota bacterium]